MRAHHYIVAIAFAVLAAPYAHAQTYRWVDERGAVTYSETLPDAGAVVYELDVVEGSAPLSALERRSLELINQERGQYARESAAPGLMPESGARAVHAPVSADSAVPPSRRPVAASAARDPCLLSPDPRCYEKNARNYDPYHGYAPGMPVNAAAVPQQAPVGTGSTAGAAGSTAGASAPAPVRP